MSRRNTLLVEDNADAREALTLLLENHGYTVQRRQRRGSAGKRLSAAAGPGHHRHKMPVLSGFDVVAQFRRLPELAGIPVIVVSAHHEVQDRIAGFDLGADDFLPKPVHVDELLARVRRHLLRSDREQEFARQSMVDALTGVLNRRGLENFFAREFERARLEGATVGVTVHGTRGDGQGSAHRARSHRQCPRHAR